MCLGGVDGYYSEDGRQPARVWVTGKSVGGGPVDAISAQLGVKAGMVIHGLGAEWRFSLQHLVGDETARPRSV